MKFEISTNVHKNMFEDDEIDVVGLYKLAVDKLVTKLEIDILGKIVNRKVDSLLG